MKMLQQLRRRFLRFSSVLSLGVSVMFGMFLAVTYHQRYMDSLSQRMVGWGSQRVPHSQLFNHWINQRGVKRVEERTQKKDHPGKHVISEAEYLLNSTRVLCWALLAESTDPLRFVSQLYMPVEYVPSMSTPEVAISSTWGQHCSKLIFFATPGFIAETSVPLVRLRHSKDINTWAALRESIMYVAQYHLASYDWFLLVEEDTFVIMENLVYYLSVHNASEPYYFGHAFDMWGSVFNRAGPGAVISRTAVRKLYNHLIKGQCSGSGTTSEVMLGICLTEVGAKVGDTRDHMGRARFIMYQPETLLVPGTLPWSHTFWTQSKFLSPEVSAK